ncbi:MAG: universal stress protein [Verrucomicrobiae bacterium]|nr:universal stress protein [Verrucomicrobiae bacterium]
MYHRLLLCTDGSAAAAVATDYALWLATKFSARLRALFVTDIRLLEGPWLADLAGAIGAQPYAALLPRLQQIQRERANSIFSELQEKCRQNGIQCEVAHETGSLVPIVRRYEHGADLVLLGQRGEHAAWGHGMLGSGVERVLRACVKPALVTPDSFRPVERILIAYDGSRGARRALDDGLELTKRLGTQTTILTACQLATEETAADALREAEAIAQARAVNVQIQLAHGEADAMILHWAHRTRADLIVMGAYGHTRIRELILGSTTHQVLHKTTVPVLMVRGQP